ncbi:hypothetical protein [Rhizobium sp. MHM7A]|uniref:hypothetical protein n=1 Tax=Rhizobium sp. MHM7A TaxID=2583233 RepID=UPI001106FB99|nr:hypothetical protein [Rhizobium sp. MHM7A]TLX16285.1 hypothetical protein FFR93_02855 [Rhizobium sp. MHM7A]
MRRTSHQHPLPLDELPDSHKAMQSGRYFIEAEGGVVFELRVDVGTRQLSGTEIMRASIRNLQHGRPASAVNLRTERNEIMILLPGQHRKDVKVAEQGYYYHGQMHSRSLKKVIALVVEAYSPKPSGPKL